MGGGRLAERLIMKRGLEVGCFGLCGFLNGFVGFFFFFFFFEGTGRSLLAGTCIHGKREASATISNSLALIGLAWRSLAHR